MEAKINGKPARLFLDTGLESFCLYRPAAERLGLNLRRVDSLFLYSRGQKPYWVTEECSVSLWGLSRKAAFAIYVRSLSSYKMLYGSVGSVIAVLLWLYVSGTIFALGAEVNFVLAARRLRHAPAER